MYKMSEIETLSHHAQTIYSEILDQIDFLDFNGKNIYFTQKQVKGNPYLYAAVKLGETRIERSIGPDNKSTRERILEIKENWKLSKLKHKERARLVSAFISAGGNAPTQQEAKVLAVLANGGLFYAGATLIGTPAFQALGNHLGVSWPSSTQTEDLDLAIEQTLPIGIAKRELDLGKMLQSSGIPFIEIPALNLKSPTTSYRIRNKNYRVELFTPMIGPTSSHPVSVFNNKSFAEPLRFLDYLLTDTQEAIIPAITGIRVNIPNPARFALHKLVISQRRGSKITKARKDLIQAELILDVLFQIQPGLVIDAYLAAKEYNEKFLQQLQTAKNLISPEVQLSWDKWLRDT